MPKGIFISFEGIEGSGKSTQIAMLADALRSVGMELLITREPGGPPVAEAIRAVLLDPQYPELLPETELLLYMASRAQHTGEWILPALNVGKIVLCDRYFDSTIAYQGAARNLNMEFINQLTLFATYGRTPDITFLIDLPVETGLERISGRALDRLEQEDISFHYKVREQYLKLAGIHHDRYIVMDGKLDANALHDQIVNSVLTRIGVRK